MQLIPVPFSKKTMFGSPESNTYSKNKQKISNVDQPNYGVARPHIENISYIRITLSIGNRKDSWASVYLHPQSVRFQYFHQKYYNLAVNCHNSWQKNTIENCIRVLEYKKTAAMFSAILYVRMNLYSGKCKYIRIQIYLQEHVRHVEHFHGI